jgi:predicted lipase
MNIPNNLYLYSKIAQLSYSTPNDEPSTVFTDLSLNVKKVYFLSSIHDAQLYTLICDDYVIFAIRGTESLVDIKTDINFLKDPFQDIIYSNNVDYTKYKGINVHQGFLKQYNSIKYSIIATVYGQMWKNTSTLKKIIFVGHSLGGGLATLAAAHLKALFKDLYIECYTFGSPRVGNKKFMRFFNDMVDYSCRCVNGCDIITKIPKLNYYHVKGLYQIGISKQNIFKRIFGNITDHYISNYINNIIIE